MDADRPRAQWVRPHVYVAYLAWFGIVSVLTVGSDEAGPLHLLAVISCPVAIVAGLWLHRPDRRAPWVVLAAGLGMFVLGDLAWIVAGPFGFPSWVDGLYYGGYVGIAAALALFARDRGAPITMWLDAAILTCSAVAIFALSVAWPVMSASAEPAAVLVTLAYPVGAAVLFTAAIGLAVTAGVTRPTSALLSGGLLALLAADVIFAAEAMVALYTPRGTLLILWGLAYAGVGAFALHPDMRRFSEPAPRQLVPVSKRRFTLLMVAVLAVPVADLLTELTPGWASSAAILVLLLLGGLRGGGIVRTLEATAAFDALTGLPNRSSLEQEFARLLSGPAPAGPGRHPLVVLFCDLDNFKLVNDGLGHSAGDGLLVTIAQRLRDTVRGGDVVARIGGDEFVVLLIDVPEADVTLIVDRLLEAVAAPAVLVDGSEVRPSMSIGVRVATPDASPESLLRDADAAMYEAKTRGRAQAAHFTDALHLQARDRLHLEGALRQAVTTDELFCLYQPEITIADERLFGMEALARWNHPKRGVLAPDVFVPLAEATGCIDAVFRRVLSSALEAQVQFERRCDFVPAVAVNLSSRQLHDGTLPHFVAGELARHELPPEQLWLEITETALAAEDGTILRPLRDLHDLGVRLAIDDFGTGWSTLSRLSSFPWDALKIDRSFVASLDDRATATIVAAMVAMARALGIVTIAEGVETSAQFDRLAAMGCDVAQGYLLSRPETVEAIAAHVASDGTWLDLVDLALER